MCGVPYEVGIKPLRLPSAITTSVGPNSDPTEDADFYECYGIHVLKFVGLDKPFHRSYAGKQH